MAKKIIKILVRDKVATLEDKSVRLKGGNNDYKIVFDFDEDWNAYEMKTAVFVFGEDSIKKPFHGNEVDGEAIYGANMCVAGVFAGDIITTSGALIPCEYSVLDVGGTPKPPTPNEYNQIMAQFSRYVSLLKGGSANQVLRKKSDSDFDFEWGQGVIVDQDYNPQSKNAVSGKALAPIFDKMNESIHSHEIRLENLEKGLSPSRFLTDDSVAHIKIAPERACPYAQINSIGGKTVRKYGENLMDDSYTLNEGGGHIPDVEIAYIDLEIGTYYFEYSASDSRIGVGYYAYDENGRYERIYPEEKGFITITTPNEYIFFVHSFGESIDEGEYTVNTFLAKPEGFAPTKTTAIKVKTPNLLPFPYTSIRVGQEVMDVGFKTNWAGLDWEVKADGSIVVNGTATGSPVLALSKDYLYADDDLYFSGSPEGGSSSTYYMVCYLEGATQNTDIGKGNKIPKGSRYRLGCYIIKGTVCDNLTFKPMVTYGNIKQPYSPPNEAPRVYEIPDDIKELMTGKGVDDVGDTIDFENGKVITKVGEILLKDAIKSCGYNAKYGFYSHSMQGKFIGNKLLCDGYTTDTWSNVYNGKTDRCIAGDGTAIIISDSRYTDVVSFVASLTDEKLIYALAETIETDLTTDFDKIIEVKGASPIEFVNEQNAPVPSSISYMLREE